MDKAIPEIGKMKIEALEKKMLEHDQVECPVIHRFGPGTYIREVHIPAGSIAIGHHQNFEHTNVMLSGCVIMLNEDGSTTEFKAPMVFVGRPGRKVGYIKEDMVWLNVYPNVENEQNIETLEAKYLTKSDNFKLSDASRNALLLGNISIDQRDFQQALVDIGVPAQLVRNQSENKDDMMELPFGGYRFKIANSPIEGRGIFAMGDIVPGEIIGPARIGQKRTALGRYTNHGAQPNAKFIATKTGDINLVATKKIFGCRGGFDGDEVLVDYREAFRLNLELAKAGKCQV